MLLNIEGSHVMKMKNEDSVCILFLEPAWLVTITT